jgi:hypothetical protein
MNFVARQCFVRVRGTGCGECIDHIGARRCCPREMLGPHGSGALRSGRAPEPEETRQRPVRGALRAAIAAAEPAAAEPAAAAAALAVSPYSAVTRYTGKDNPTVHDAPALQSADRIGSCAATRYHLVAVTPLDLGADRP